MKINKIICCVLAAMMTICLIGCANLAQLITPTPSPTTVPTATPTATPTPTPTPTPEPNIDSFRVGYGDEKGYMSRFFDFGFDIPKGWYYYDRSMLDQGNQIQALNTDKEAYFQEYIDRLKSGETFQDYFAFNTETDEMVFVYVKDFSDPKDEGRTEQDILDYYAESVFDLDNDGKIEATNILSENLRLNRADHPFYFYEQPYHDVNFYCAIIAIPQGTTYAIIIVSCLDRQTTSQIIYSIAPLRF
jgi:hypothetical protein